MSTSDPVIEEADAEEEEEVELGRTPLKEPDLKQKSAGDASIMSNQSESVGTALSDSPDSMDKNTFIGLFLVYFSVFLDLMGMSLVQPILPFYAEQFHANSTKLGAIYSGYAGMQMIAAFVMGKMSDKYGRRPSIIVSLCGTGIGCLATGFAWNYPSLLGFRMLSGSFGGSPPIAQAYITDVVPPASRPKYLGAVGATIAMAFIVGPGIGSGLAEFNIRVPFFVSSGLAFGGAIFAVFWLQESHPTILAAKKKKNDEMTADVTAEMDIDEKSELKVDTTLDSPASTTPEIEEMDKPKLKGDIPSAVYVASFAYFLSSLAWSAYTSMFALFLEAKFGFESLEIGFSTLTLATTYVFSTVLLFKKLSDTVGLYWTFIVGCGFVAFGLACIPAVDNQWVTLTFVLCGVAVGQGFIMPSMSSIAADFTNVLNRGKVMAFSNASNSFGLVIGPLLHGALYGIWIGYPFIIGAGFVIAAALVVLGMIFKYPNARAPKRLLSRKTTEAGMEWAEIEIPTKEDYERLGKYLGKLLTRRGYNRWVTHADKIEEMLSKVFPHLSQGSFEEHMRDVRFVINSVNALPTEFGSMKATAGLKLH